MANASIPVAAPAVTSQRLDAEQVTTESVVVLRERMQIVQAVSPIVDALTTLALLAGASADLNGTLIGVGKTGRLLAVEFGSSAACKWQIKTVDGAAEVVRVTLYTSGLAGQQPSRSWQTPDLNMVTRAYGNGDERFRVTVTNLDGRNPADASVTIFWDEHDEV